MTSAPSPRLPTITASLRPHPGSHRPTLAERILVTLSASPGGDLRLVFRIEGDRLERIRLPAPATPAFTDGLWRHTCLEAFLAVPGEAAYREYNFSPSGQWAAYAFQRWREADSDFVPAGAPRLCCRREPAFIELDALLPATLLPALAAGGDLQAGLAAVLEDDRGQLEYWALRHDHDQPDFHARDSFSLVLATAAPASACRP